MLIRTRITIASLAVTVVTAVTLVVAAYSAQQAAEARFVDAALSGKRVLLEQIVMRHVSEMSAFSKALTRDSVTINALRKGDAKVLQEQVDTTQNTFISDGTLERVQLFDPEGNYLASAPQRFSGRTAKTLVNQAVTDQSTVSSLVRDDDGALQAAVAFPLYARGKLKGIALFSRDIQRILDDFQRNDGSDVFLYDTAGKQLQLGTDNQQKELSRQNEATGDDRLQVVEHGGRYSAISTIAIHDGGGERIGTLAVSKDQTETYRIQAMAKYTSGAIVLLILVAASIGLFWYIRRVFRPIDRVIVSLTAIASGDLSHPVEASSRDDETGRLGNALASLVSQWRELITDITASLDHLQAAGNDLRAVTTDSGELITRQSQETGQVATAINEMTANVREVAGNAVAAAGAATLASTKAADGQMIVHKTVESIRQLATDIEHAGAVVGRVRDESDNIGSVLDVIHSISEQTNLLALNAAIEAARAGEQGRGFAVVADEVRTLASRTQASTEEIQQMISHLQKGAKEAVRVIDASQASSSATVGLASEAGDALAGIAESSQHSNLINSQIAGAADQQQTVSEMINESVVQIAQLAEDSREHVQQTEMAAQTVSDCSVRLGVLVGRFKL